MLHLRSKALLLLIGAIIGYFLNISIHASESLEEQAFFHARPAGIVSQEAQIFEKRNALISQEAGINTKEKSIEVEVKEIDSVMIEMYKKQYFGLEQYQTAIEKILVIMSKNGTRNSVITVYSARLDEVKAQRLSIYKKIMLEKKK